MQRILLVMVLISPAWGGVREADSTEPAASESRFLAGLRQVTSEGKSGEGYFAPDGSAVIFQSIRGVHPFYQIYTKGCSQPFEPDGPETMVSTGRGRTTCAFFHPDGRRIIYASSHLDPNLDEQLRQERARLEKSRRDPKARRSYSWAFDPHMDIFEADVDGANLRRLSDAAGYDAEGAYSPDGNRVVFCSFRNGNGDLYIMDRDGGNLCQLTDSPGYDGGPFFSPDGKRVIFRGEVRRRKYLQLFVVNADGTEERQLTDNDFVNWGPYWHPGGKHVIYATSRHGHRNYELYLLKIDTGRQERVTHSPGADILPVFSPDGRKLMWTSKRGENRAGRKESQLWIADWVYGE